MAGKAVERFSIADAAVGTGQGTENRFTLKLKIETRVCIANPATGPSAVWMRKENTLEENIWEENTKPRVALLEIFTWAVVSEL